MEKKILIILPSLKICNGVASYAMNYYRNFDKKKYKMDFIVPEENKSEYFEEIENDGNKVFYVPQIGIKNSFKTLKVIETFFKQHQNKYSIVHCHAANMGAFYLYYAKKYKMKCRIIHSHATKYADKPIKNIRNTILAYFSKKYANEYFTCSKLAGQFMFGSKYKYHVINNAINPDNFKFNEEIRKKIRKIEKIDKNEFVIGNFGRYVPQKNQTYLIEIFNKYLEINKNSKLLLIGDGELEKELKNRVKELKIQNKVIFRKPVSNIHEYFQAIDIFVLTSVYEGLPVVGIEAQASDLECIFADAITKEMNICKKIKYIKLNSNSEWLKAFEKKHKKTKTRKENNDIIRKKGYDIKIEAKKLEKIYNDLEKKYSNKQKI